MNNSNPPSSSGAGSPRPKPPLRPRHVGLIRAKLQLGHPTRDIRQTRLVGWYDDRLQEPMCLLFVTSSRGLRRNDPKVQVIRASQGERFTYVTMLVAVSTRRRFRISKRGQTLEIAQRRGRKVFWHRLRGPLRLLVLASADLREVSD